VVLLATLALAAYRILLQYLFHSASQASCGLRWPLVALHM
jgi:hypothetical protein